MSGVREGSGELSGGDNERAPKRLKTPPQSSNTIDRISELPEALILHILSFLPTRDVMNTASLAKRWQYLWTRVPELYFDWDNEPSYVEDDDRYDDHCVKKTNRALMLCVCPKVNSFGFRLRYNYKYVDDFDLWTQFAASREVEKFELDFSPGPGGYSYILQPPMFLNSSFRELRLGYCHFWHGYLENVSWKSLKKLSISDGDLRHEGLEAILAGTPALEILDWSMDYYRDVYGVLVCFKHSRLKKLILEVREGKGDYSVVPELKISAPKLECLQLSGYYGISELVNTTCLVEAILSTQDEYEIFKNKEVVYSLLNVKTLTIDTKAIQEIEMLLEDDVPPLSSKCKCLTIDTHLWKTDPSAMASLLKCTPEVETLIVTVAKSQHKFQDIFSQDKNSEADQFWASQEVEASNYFRHLKTVKFYRFWDYRAVAFPFVRFVLKNAKVLHEINIYWQEDEHFHKAGPPVVEESGTHAGFGKYSSDAKILVYL